MHLPWCILFSRSNCQHLVSNSLQDMQAKKSQNKTAQISLKSNKYSKTKKWIVFTQKFINWIVELYCCFLYRNRSIKKKWYKNTPHHLPKWIPGTQSVRINILTATACIFALWCRIHTIGIVNNNTLCHTLMRNGVFFLKKNHCLHLWDFPLVAKNK